MLHLLHSLGIPSGTLNEGQQGLSAVSPGVIKLQVCSNAYLLEYFCTKLSWQKAEPDLQNRN